MDQFVVKSIEKLDLVVNARYGSLWWICGCFDAFCHKLEERCKDFTDS